ncbi:hypothetical protein [Mycolicibacterium sp.]|jgi:hypothetical protein|uniref:hypothetical protein n=1 Tax=Mycolicibacterium sp. TaxID=2320850 RepID=UPI0028AD9B65|nr:hypothetical protein [Mycolicibacterium sp.]
MARIRVLSDMETTSVDLHALRSAARQLDIAADLLDSTLAGHLGALRCGGGRLRDGLDQLSADIAAWRRAARETAQALRVGADRYAEHEADAVAALR